MLIGRYMCGAFLYDIGGMIIELIRVEFEALCKDVVSEEFI